MKKVFRILAVAALLLSLFVVGVCAADGTAPDCADHAGEWRPIYNSADKDNGTGVVFDNYGIKLTESGSYYLAEDITCGRINIMGDTEAANAEGGFNVTLCLNGHDIIAPGTDTSNHHGIRVGRYHSLVLTNCGNEGGTVRGGGTISRNLLLMQYSAVEVYGNVHFDGNTTNTQSVAVQANASASFTMYGGTINNNVFASDGKNTGGNTAALLGGIGSTIRLLGGEISGNRITATANGSYVAAVVTNAGTVEIGEGFTISDNVINAKTYGAGGVLGLDADKTDTSIAKITMTGGAIANNTCNRSGGVAMHDATTFNMSGGEITGNKANQYGGGLCVSHGTVTMSDGEISGNTLTNAKPYGAQVAVGSNYAGDTIVFTMTGGTIAAAQGVDSNDLTVCHGTANIQGGTVTGKVDTVGMITEAVLNISGGTIFGKMANGELERSSGVAADSAITITGGKFSAADNDSDKLAEWLAAGATLFPVTENGIQFYQTDPTSQAVCDGSHSGWTKLNTNSYTGNEITSSGQYYLGTDIKASLSQITVDGVKYAVNVTADDVTLCLCGHSIIPSNSAVAAIRCSGKNLKIVNCSASNGTITGKATCSVQVVEGGSVTIGDNVHIDGASVVPVMVGSNAAFYMRGGTISGNTFSGADTAVAPVVLGENGSFTMSGGTISGNTVTGTASGYVGGAVAAAGTATVDLRRGTISGNVVTHTVPDGTDVYGYAGGAVVLNGGTMKVLSGVTINGNVATSNKISAGAVCANAGTTVTMTGGTISGNTANKKSNVGTNNGGGVALYGTDTAFTMSGGTISGNNVTGTGGGVEIADSSAVFTMTGGTITENNAGRWGGGVCIRKGTFNLSGGTIEDNDLSSAYEYGNQVTVGLYAKDCSGTFNMTGGAIVDTAVDTTDGAETSTDVTVSQGTANVSGGSIAGQVATLGIVTPAALNISGGTITGDVTNAVLLPQADQAAAEIQLRKNCTITITDGEIIGALSSTSHDDRQAETKYVISGGKFSGETDRGDLVRFLDEAQDLLSVQDIDEGQLVYEVGVGLAYNGAHMAFGSSLDFGLYLGADLGDYSTDLADYTCILTGGDEDVTYDLKVENGNLLFMAHGIAAKEMRDDLTFTLMKGDDVWFTRTMSVYDAACEFRANELNAAAENGTEANGDYITMLADMVHYGTQAQKRFNYNTRAVLDKPDLEEMSEAVSGDWTSSGVSVTNEQGSKVSTSLSLKDQIELNFYISDPKATVSEVTFADVEIPAAEYTVTNATGTNNTQTLISFREIPVTLVKEVAAFTVELADGTTFEVSGSIADHVNMAQDSNTEGKLIDALQKYVDSVCEVLSKASDSAVARVTVQGEAEE